MRAIPLFAVIAYAVALLAAPVATPHGIAHKPVAKMSLRERERFQVRVIRHDRYVIAYWLGRKQNWRFDGRHPAGAAQALPDLRFHRAQLQWTEHELRQTRSALRRNRGFVTGPVAHFAFWHCVTNGAYPGAPHEGNGYNGSYTGPLGMTTPWAGHYPPASDWVHTPVQVVYAIAELEFRQNGYSRAWLVGQWPNTGPPCFGRL